MLLLTGCWDYRGLGEQTVVTGIAVDLGEEGRGYSLTFEIVDLSGGEGGQFGSILLTVEGETLGEAVYDAYARLHSHVSFGVVDVVIVGRRVAKEVGLEPLVDYLIRDRDTRNSLRMVVAGTETAGELLDPAAEEGEEADGPGQSGGPRQPLSKVLGEALSPQRRGEASSATEARALYEIYHILQRGTSDLALPIVRLSEAEDIPFALDGLALFHGGRMVGTLEEADMPVYLLATTDLRDRVFPVEVQGERGVMAVRRSQAGVNFALGEGGLRFFLDIRVTADALQLPEGWAEVDAEMVRRLEAGAEETLSREVLELVRPLLKEGHDVFGFAEAVRNRDPRLWEQIEGDWRAWLRESEIEPRIEVRIRDSGMRR